MHPQRKRHETDIERIMRLELEHRGLVFESQFPTRSGFILDFAFPEERLGVECDGEKWHRPGNRRDRFRDYLLKRAGWTVMRFTGTEIKDDVVSCVDRVAAYLASRV